MLWQPSVKGESGGWRPETAREAAIDYLYSFVDLDWTPEQIPKRASARDWDVQIGGIVQDAAGEQCPLNDQQIAVTRLQESSCFAVFDLMEIIAEIRKEIVQERKRAGGNCLFCGKPFSGKEGAGRRRQFCNDNCRVAAHRQRQNMNRRTAILQEQKELRDLWAKHHIEDQLITFLYNILIEQGQEAAYIATDAIIHYGSEQVTRAQPDEPQPKRSRATRSTKREQEKRNAVLLQNRGLRDLWEKSHIDGPLLTMLQELLLEQGTGAARLATDALIVYASEWQEDQKLEETSTPLLEVNQTHPFEMRVLIYRTQPQGQEPDLTGIWLEQARGANANAVLSVAKSYYAQWHDPCVLLKHEEDGSERQLDAWPTPPKGQSYEDYCKQLRIEQIERAAAKRLQCIEEEKEEEEQP